MGRRGREKAKQQALSAPVTEYRDADGNVLALRGALSPATRRQYSDTLAGGLHRAVLERDAWPYVALEPPGLAADLYRLAGSRHRSEPPPTHLAVAGALDAFVRIEAPANTTELAGVDPAAVATVATARRPVQERLLKLRWTGTILPTPALAQQAQMSTAEYAAF